MPSVGTPRSKTPVSSAGAPVSYTEDGPPDRMMPTGFFAAMSAADAVCGTISLYTPASRTRRAMSWAYCAPKSTTRTGRWEVSVCSVNAGSPWGSRG
jgi:hypothetical protein